MSNCLINNMNVYSSNHDHKGEGLIVINTNVL